MSMQDHLDETNVVNSIRLQLRHPSGGYKIWIIVEGEADQRLFSKLIDGDHVEIELSHGGVTSVVRAVSELSNETDSVLGIRDADFYYLNRKKVIIRNIFYTDLHDAEMMLISCDNAYKAVISEYICKEKNPNSLRNKVLISISFIGGLRWINDSDGLGLNFKKFGLGSIYDGGSLCLNEEGFLSAIMKRSPGKKREVTGDEVVSKIKDTSDFFNLCNGHDFQRALALYVNSISGKGVKHEEIGKSFRIAYRFEDFQKTKLYERLKKWSDNKSKGLFKNANQGLN